MIVLFPLSVSAAVTRETYTNKSGTVVGRSYTSPVKGGTSTVYRDPKGNTLGFSRTNNTYGPTQTRILDKSGTYRGMIMGGMIKDSKGNTVGNVKNTTPSKGTTNGKK